LSFRLHFYWEKENGEKEREGEEKKEGREE